VLIGQFFLTTLAGFAFAQLEFRGKDVLFVLVLLQLFILPEVLIVENYRSRRAWPCSTASWASARPTWHRPSASS
jgi:ABC-type glycerol-3-phosphate transport system permease component